MGLFERFKRKPAEDTTPQAGKPNEVGKLKVALNRTRAFLATAFAADPEGLVDEEYYDEWTDALVLADVSVNLATDLTEKIKVRMRELGQVKKAEVADVARSVIAHLLIDGVATPQELDPAVLNVVLLVGVNGSGKTTLAAKLASRLKNDGRCVLLCAADTFRAAAVDQLKVWSERSGVDIVLGASEADPASVVFDATEAAKARGTEVLIVDTAGRLQTKGNLMAELSKIARTITKACPEANTTQLLVLDATVGQNAISQAQLFNECCTLTGLAVTKLDGTAKGGALLAVVDLLKVPVLYVGIGEQLGDLVEFSAEEFAAGMIP